MKKFLLYTLTVIIFVPTLAFASVDTNLTYGAHGTGVTELQKFLIKKGFLTGQSTGNFFSLTRKAVVAYQTSLGLPATGFVGVLTRAKINADILQTSTNTTSFINPIIQPIVVNPPTQAPAFVAGCNSTAGFSMTTGMPCNGTPTNPIANNILTSPTLTSCGIINKSNSYTLSSDLLTVSDINCLKISNAKFVTIDCQGHTISGKNPIYIDYSSDVIIKSCIINSSVNDESKEGNGGGIAIDSSNNVSFLKNTINSKKLSASMIMVNNSSGITLDGNTIYGTYQQNISTGALIQNNIFTAPSSSLNIYPAMIIFNLGSGNKAIGNTLEGSAAGVASIHLGADDGVVLSDESNDTISNNITTDVYDCGIENVGFIQNSIFEGNKTTNAGVCGIGGWYWSSLLGNIYKNNTATDARTLFAFSRSYGLRPAMVDEGGHATPADNVVYFKDNQFIGNTFIRPRMTDYFSSTFSVIPDQAGLSSLPGEKPIAESSLSIGNNTFTGNNFGNITDPYFSSQNMAIDGGGNICVQPDASVAGQYPLRCQ